MHDNKEVEIYADGACKGNPGRGGWACILRFADLQREIFGCSPFTTNNRMELAGAIEGLISALSSPAPPPAKAAAWPRR